MNRQHSQDTHRVSGNSADSGGSNNSGSSYSSFQGVQEPEIDYEDDTNENEAPGIHQSTDCYIPRGNRFNHRTFRGQPSQYDRRGQCAFYDNAWNVPGREGFLSSNQSSGSDSSYPSATPDCNHKATETDQSIQKHKSCSIKKICKCVVWTAIFLGISFGVALSTLNNVNTSDLERQMLQGGGSGLGSGSDSGGHCYNSTTNGCVDQCYNICNGDYQSCWTCKGYITCANRILHQRNCSDSHLVWDDHTKRCESVSNTCP